MNATVPNRIEAVLKVTERCNINCSYCYYFNKGNDDYRNHPVYIAEDTIREVAAFLAQGVGDLKADRVVVDFHGGEPLLMKPRRFAAMCRHLQDAIRPLCALVLNVQTNATTIDDEWIDVFARYSVGVGISLDGPAQYNDQFRVDHKGRGTYEATARGIARIREAAESGLIRKPGGLCVINPKFSAKTIYRHFVDDLGFESMDFLLPIESHDDFDHTSLQGYKQFLLDLFHEWTSDDNPRIRVRILEKMSRILTHGSAGQRQIRAERNGRYHLVVIASNGDLRPDDQLLPLNLPWAPALNVRNCSLSSFAKTSEWRLVEDAAGALPESCRDCCWQAVCGGGGSFHGRMINQHSRARGFNNPSIFCEALKALNEEICAYLIAHGVPFDRILESLGTEAASASHPGHLPVARSTQRVIPIAAV